ncbi:hypothetical protein MKZ38_009876 [Zalerion maritima]|uniref:L-2-hydroxyglutarate dehydrogenase, mitochondrial n=1 Tax=Zalerion maritima TaxID=339359 RepID=A0AAD5RT20_9PEZI|nr:hypothetical protein MKZ38_009876 [Zalerion maritima]
MVEELDFDAVIIGGGVIGLSIAHSLTSHHSSPLDPSRILLLERHPQLGTETSSRNSEVIHGGLYYPPASLKTRLCIRGRRLLYSFCESHNVPHRKTGKWILAQDCAQTGALKRMIEKTKSLRDVEDGVGGTLGETPLRWVSREESEREEPDVHVDWEAGGSILESPETGIVDSHSFMLALEGRFTEAGGTVAVESPVSKATPLPAPGSDSLGSNGWEITVSPTSTIPDPSAITSRAVINAAGLSAVSLFNAILSSLPSEASPAEKLPPLKYAKGNYFSYSRSSPRPSRLLYPAPVAGASGLGTHLTLDLSDPPRVRFGPDVEWVTPFSSPSSSSPPSPEPEPEPRPEETIPTEIYAPNPAHLAQATREIKKYLPSIDASSLVPDYSGIRPKLSLHHNQEGGGLGEGKGFVDFYVRKEKGFAGLVNCLGIESPGLTSSLAVGEMVARLVVGEGDWGEREGLKR